MLMILARDVCARLAAGLSCVLLTLALALAGCSRPETPALAAAEGGAGAQAGANAGTHTDTHTGANAAAGAAPAASAGAALPAEVLAFKARRDACDHFRGEEPYDAARAKFLADAMQQNCRGTDNALRELRQRYAAQAAVLAALQDYEDRIE